MSARSNDRHTCRKLGVVLAGLIAAALPLAARASTVGLYTDESGSSCSFSGNNPGVVTAYVVVRPGPEGFRAIRDVIWKGDDQNGVPVSSGVYYCVLRAGNERRTQKLVLLK
jgi:hypothetical protein